MTDYVEKIRDFNASGKLPATFRANKGSNTDELIFRAHRHKVQLALAGDTPPEALPFPGKKDSVTKTRVDQSLPARLQRDKTLEPVDRQRGAIHCAVRPTSSSTPTILAWRPDEVQQILLPRERSI